MNHPILSPTSRLLHAPSLSPRAVLRSTIDVDKSASIINSLVSIVFTNGYVTLYSGIMFNLEEMRKHAGGRADISPIILRDYRE